MFIRSLPLFLYSGLAFAATAPTFPALTYSTYLRDNFTPAAIATDSSGNIYMAGTAVLDNNQATVLVVKLNARASQYLYVRYVGGSINDSASAIAVDSAGDAYVAGSTSSPDFPVTSGGNFTTAPVSGIIERSFVFKLDPNGELAYSVLVGGATDSYAQAVAVNASGQVLVSGTSNDTGFPSTPGVYSVANTAGSPYLLELDPTGTKIIFSATGIGGTALAFESSGNIYMAGTTGSLTYPTTTGTYQPTFPVFQTCIAPCGGTFQGPNQYVTKLDPTGSTIIFSTSVSGTGNTVNNGLAVDAAGNIYLTGLAGAGYPYTVTPPTIPQGPAISNLATPALPFLSKLDPAGQKLLFSVPVGGAGVQVDSNGFVYVGGFLGNFHLYDVAASLPALASLPAACLSSEATGIPAQSAYASQVDAASGNVLGSQFLGGSSLTISGVALAGSTLWIAGATNFANFPFSPNALVSPNIGPNVFPGAYLGAVDFSQSRPATGTPQIGCMVDAANLDATGPIVPYQLLTIFGSGLGPAKGVSATNYSTTELSGVSVSLGSLAAPLLYVASNQINLAVPLVDDGSDTVMKVTVNGVSSPALQFPVTFFNPSVFVVPGSYLFASAESFAVALNANGSVNSSTNPAQLGSVISLFVNGLSNPQVSSEPPDLYLGGVSLYAPGGSLLNFSQPNPFVVEVKLPVPSSTANLSCQANVCVASFEVYDLASYLSGPAPAASSGLKFSGEYYVAQTP
jgi:uncharacterized protein (TIGR03437 family)